MKKLLPLLIIAFLAWLPTTDAQLTISGENAVVCDNGTVSIDVSVSNFNDIISAQFGVTWDPDVVELTSVTNNMPASALYNTVNAPTGELRFSWFDAVPPLGYTPPGPPAGSQIIFTINFNIVGDYSTNNATAINFGSVPGFNMEIASSGGLIPNGSINIVPGNVTLDDNTPPTITCPSSITVTAGIGQSSAVVTYAAPGVSDNCGALPAPPTCVPASGSSFNIGTTNVNCTATDGAGNSANCSFSITVNPPPANPNALMILADDYAVECNDTTVDVPVRVRNFNDMTSAQFAMVWNESVLQYTGFTDSINANGHTTAIYNTLNTATGQFRFSWFDADGVPGEDLSDSTVIFTLHFKLLDENALPDTVVVTGVPGFTAEFADINGLLGPGDYAFEHAIISLIPDTTPPSITCPANQTLVANASCQATLLNYTALASATDNCSDPADIVITQVPVAGTVITDTTQVMLIAADEAGNKDTCSITVNFVDNTNPVITCPANVSVGNDLGECTAVVALVATATDNCGVLSITDNGPAGDEFPLGLTTVTFTATDINGHIATCQTTVTVSDTEDPSINCPANISRGTDAGVCTAVVTWTAPVASDNCPNVTVTCTPASGATFPIGDSTVVCIVTDQAGNADTCSFVVTVSDDEAPAITCIADQTIFADTSCEATLPNFIGMVTASDNCTASPTITQSPAAGTVVTDTTALMLIATDAAGLKDTCFFSVNFVDSLLPTIVCPANDTLDVDSAACFATFTLPAATASDNCGILSLTDDAPAGGEFDAGATTVTFTATDVNGNVATCQTIVVVNDTIPPVITCPSNISQSTDQDDCAAVVTWATPTVDDNCTNLTITCIPPSGTSFPVGDSTVVCIVEDPGGNMDTCTFVVTVSDDQAPTLQCPTDTSILVPSGTVDTVINNIFLFFIGDNCTLDTSYYHFAGAIPTGGGTGADASGTAFPIGTTTVTYYGVDLAGNIDSCSFDVTIVEDVTITLNCPQPLVQDNDLGLCGAFVTNGLVATVSPQGAAQSSSFQISGATIGNGVGLNAAGGYNVGVSTITFTAISSTNDTATCTTTVTINDVESPNFTNCPTDTVTVDNTIDECGVIFTGSIVPVATDNCPNLSLSYNFAVGSLAPIGYSTVNATATDGSGNATICAYVLQVVDSQAPKFLNCQNGSTITRNNDQNQCGAVVAWAPAVTAQDNCTLLAFTETSPGNGDFFPVGTSIVTYTAVDDKGNVSTCEINVVVNDNQAPVIQCPGNQQPVNTTLNQCSASVNFPVPTAADNCTVVSFGPTTPVGPVFDAGVHTLVYVATDAAGNTTTCSFTVTVEDNQFPFIPNMPADITAYSTANDCGTTVSWTPPGMPIDNCGIDIFGPSGGAPGDFFGVGAHVVKYVAQDVNGNITVESLNITVLDTMPPVINCPAGISITVDGATIDDPDSYITVTQPIDCDHIQLEFGSLSASDPCGVSSFSQTGGLPSGSSFPVGTSTVTYQAMDNNGNFSTCSVVINVVDVQIAPATVSQGLICEGGTTTFAVGTYPGASYTWTFGNNVVSTNPSFTVADATLNQSGIYTVLVSTSFCDFTFTTELNVTAVPVVTIDANDILCTSNGLPLTLNATNSSSANVTNWTWTFPNGTTPTGPSQVVQNPTASDSGTYCVTATTQFGCTATACEQINVSTGPTMPVLNGTTSSTCLNSNPNDVVTLFGQLYSGNNVTYLWYAEPAIGSGLVNINNPIVSVHPTAAGTFTYYFYVVVDGCISDTASWALVVEAPPVIDLEVVGATQCVDGTTDVTLVDNGTGATNWMWSGGPFGNLPGNTNSVVLQDVTPSYSGIYTVVAKSDIGCSNTASIPLTFTAAPSPADLTLSETTICEGGSVTLTGTQYSGIVNYIWLGNSVPPNSQNDYVITVFPTGTGNFSYGFAAFVNGCYTDTIFQIITVSPAPALDINVAGNTVCVNGNTKLTLTPSISGLHDIEWTDANGTVLANTNALVLQDVTSADSGPIYLSATNQQGCFGFGSTTLDITDALEGLTATDSMNNCELGIVTLRASSIANANYSWFKPNAVNPFSSNQTVTVGNAADGIYTVVASLEGCTDTATISVNLPEVLNANNKEVACIINTPQEFNILANDIYDADQPFTITILQEPLNGTVKYVEKDSIYRYKPTGGFWGTDYLIYEICYDACPTLCSNAIVTFNVNYDPSECVVTTVISPNSDGYNDELVVSCLVNEGAYPLNTIIIYNQWGDKVYDAAPYNNNWRGTHDGSNLPDGTYFYVFQRDPQTPAQKGFVMIYR